MGSCVKITVIIAGVVGVLLVIAGCILGFSNVLDGYINDQIVASVILEEGTEQYERWEELPFPLQFKIYAFNVSNAEDILANGAKPIVEEIGPFVYNQYRHKEDIVYDEEKDTLTYKPYLQFEFDEEASAYPEDTNITILNVPLMGIFYTAEGNSFQEVSLNLAWKDMFHGGGFFLTVSAKKYFFEGYQFCIMDQLQGAAYAFARTACNTIRNELPESQTLVADSEKIQFAFFAHKHNNTDGEYRISAGIQDYHTLGAISSWEGQEYLDTWEGANSTCNRIRGRDSSLYPPFNNESSRFDIFNTDICRIVNLKTVGTSDYEGIEGIRATLGLEEMVNDGDKSCYCINRTQNLVGEVDCLPDGFADMYNCLKAPMIVSFPHMLGGDEIFTDTVEGLEPNADSHTTFVLIEPDTGTPLRGAKRIQFNMIVRPFERFAVTANITPAVLPILWVEEGFDLPEEQLDILRDTYFNKLRILNIVSYTLLGVGIALIVISVGYFLVRLF